MRGARLALSALALGACGDPAWDGYHEGAFVAELGCTFTFSPVGGDGPGPPNHAVGFAWLRGDGEGTTPDPQDVSDIGTWPTVRLRLHHAPRPDHFEERAGLGRVALGQVFAWDDHDRDGAWDDAEPLVGLAHDAVFVVVPEDETGSLAASFGPGLHLVDPLPCEAGTGLRITHAGHPGCLLEPVAAGPMRFFSFSCP